MVYDTTKQVLTVQDAPRERLVDLHECPYCRRPYGRDFEHSEDDSEDDHHAYGNLDPDRPFLDPNYFAMLAASTRGSPANTEPGTPTGRRLQPAALRSGRSRDVSGAAGPPSGAEFVTSEPTPAASRGISSSAFNPGYFQQHFRELRREVRLLALAHESDYPLAKSLSDLFGSLDRQLRDDLTRRQPGGRLGTPADVAGTVAFLLSPEGRWVSGQLVKADGGFSA